VGKQTNNLRHQNPKKTKRTVSIVAADIKEDRRVTGRNLPVPMGSQMNYEQGSFGQPGPCEEVGSLSAQASLLKPNRERVRTCKGFFSSVNLSSMTMLYNIVPMDKTMVSLSLTARA
jgi:hypothetical protein